MFRSFIARTIRGRRPRLRRPVEEWTKGAVAAPSAAAAASSSPAAVLAAAACATVAFQYVAVTHESESCGSVATPHTTCSCQSIHQQSHQPPQIEDPRSSSRYGVQEDGDAATTGSPFRLKQEYDIVKVLGEGAYGMVYQARRKKDGVAVALKTMPRDLTGQTDFEREVAALQLLSKPPGHQHIVQLYDLHRDETNYYLVMELVRGSELFEHLIVNGPYSEHVASIFLRQFAEAISYVHSTGLCHSDLKPENLMITSSASNSSSSTDHDDDGLEDTPILKVVDFGCACSHDSSRKDLQLPAQEFATGCSFLHQVALGNQFELAKILQARPSFVNFRDYDRRTALHIAASEGHVDICRFLVARGARVNRTDRWGGSPLDDAHREKHYDVIQYLRQHGAKFGSTSQATNFITAASEGDREEVQTLLEFGNFDLNQGDYDKRTALHLAAGEGRLDIVALLCEAGADVNVEDRWGNRPIDDAKLAKMNSTDIVKVLEQHGAKSSAIAVSPDQHDPSNDNSENHTTQPSERSKEEEEIGPSGTRAYWPPELFAKGATSTPEADCWATGVIMYLLLTGSHPFDKQADKTDDAVKEAILMVGPEKDDHMELMNELVFDDRIEGLSESCIELMRQLMHPDPQKRMTSDKFLRHPWIQGLTASWKTMEKTHDELKAFWQNRFRAEIMTKFAAGIGISGETLSEKDLKKIFHALDLKKNGVLELEEIQTAFRDLGVPDKNIRAIFACADLDGTGVIHFDEFKTLMRRHVGDGPGLQVSYLQRRFKSRILGKFAASKGDTTSDKDKLREVFNAIDLEGNGVLDPHEIRVVLRSAGEPEDVISRIVASLDLNRDGGVSWEEFLEIMSMRDE